MSSRKPHSLNLPVGLLDLLSLESNKIYDLFSCADQISLDKLPIPKGFGKTGALLFFEASTRTRMSFETACARLGVYPLLLQGESQSSLKKGETLQDTVLNVAAMKPSFMVIRCGDDLDLQEMSQQISVPILNAGWGKKGHPTQALLDAFTIYKNFGACEGQRVLIVGDIRHSRVAASHFELAIKLGYEVALCGPKEFLPQKTSLKVFESLHEGLQWATVAMALRVQLERHAESYSLADYRDHFGFTERNLSFLSSQALVMHPGPINHGVELDSVIFQDPRCRVLDQVTNGVLIRQALILNVLEGKL